MVKYSSLVVGILLFVQQLVDAQVKIEVENGIAWRDPQAWGIEGRGWTNGLARYYDRLPAKAEETVPKLVWGFSRESAGMSVRFITDAKKIRVRYRLSSPASSHGWGDMSNMAASGFDLYARMRDDSGEWIWRWAGGNKPTKQNSDNLLADGLAPGRRLYVLNLPVYNGVEKLEIGVNADAAFEPVSPRTAPPIVFYGTSIMQGGIASRPGLVIPAEIGRRLDRPVINLGFCGVGRMDAPVADLLAELNPAVYVIDCLPNMDAALVGKRTEPFVHRLRQAHPTTPILLVECHDYPSPGLFPSKDRALRQEQEALRAAYDRLVNNGVRNLHYLSGRELIGLDSEGTGDGIHPNALGTSRYVVAYEKALLSPNIVWMVQHSSFRGDGTKARDVFKNWALERFGR